MGSYHRSYLLPFLLTIAPAAAFGLRTIGSGGDPDLNRVVDNCTAQYTFDRDQCAALMECTLTKMPGDVTADFGSGSNIASLVPTILALIGAGPLDLVQLTFTSPLRALVTCIFAIGLPQGLFRQFHRHSRMSDARPSSPRVRQWDIPVPIGYTKWAPNQYVRTLKRIVVDLVILGLAGLMLWQNIALGLQSIVTWGCQHSWLLICWPIACVVWLVAALGGMALLTKKLVVRYSEDAAGCTRSLWDLPRLAYKLPVPRGGALPLVVETSPAPSTMEEATGRDGMEGRRKTNGELDVRGLEENNCAHCDMPKLEPFFTVTLTMRFDAAWSWYEAALESGAVGIYLYSTFVLTSSLFISGSEGITYMVVMVLCLSGIRILEGM